MDIEQAAVNHDNLETRQAEVDDLLARVRETVARTREVIQHTQEMLGPSPSEASTPEGGAD